MHQPSVLLVVGGGIGAYKALELARLLAKARIGCVPVLTAAGSRFVTPLSLAALAGQPVRSELFCLDDEASMSHIELSRAADLVVVAPATADLMAKAAHGLADDLASTLLLATDKPIVWAPAMNVRMWLHPATQHNRGLLVDRGDSFVGPDEGEMACGEFGPGRLAEPVAILEAIQARLGPRERPLSGRRALVTAGPTVEPIDPVRVLTNLSSGRQGYAIAGRLAELGAHVALVSGPTALSAPIGVERVNVARAEEMLSAAMAALPVDLAVCVAAVSDWRVASPSTSKIKRSASAAPTLRLVENPDILATLAAAGPRRPALLVGFAAETGNAVAHAREKRLKKGCDWIVANDVAGGRVIGGEDNEVILVTEEGDDAWPRLSKTQVARRLCDRIVARLVNGRDADPL